MTARSPICVALAVAGLAGPVHAQGPEAASGQAAPAAELLAPRNRAVAEVVGFRSFVVHDPARAYDPAAYADGEAKRPRFRPIRVALWYPASDLTTAPLTAADYGRLADPERPLDAWSPDEVLAYEDSLAAVLEADGLDRDAARARLDAPVGAVWEAPPADGRAPLVLYLPGVGESLAESAAAFERLAARGAIVAALPALGPAPGVETEDGEGLETRARDAAFALGFLLDELAASIGGVALVGRGWGATAAAAVATRRPEIEALVLLGGAPEPLQALPDWDPIRLRVPTLVVGDGGPGDLVRFAPRTRVAGPARLEGRVLDAVAAFLEAGVEPEVDDARGPAGGSTTAGLASPPDVAALVRLYRTGRGAEAEAAIRAARTAVPAAYGATTLGSVGEFLLAVDPAAAVPALELAARIHPGSERLGRLLTAARERAPSTAAAPADTAQGRR